MMKYTLALLLVLLCKVSSAQTDGYHRPAFTLKLFVDSANFYQADIPESTYFPKEGVVQIFSGETLYIEADVVGNKLANFKAVPAIINKEKTLTIIFEQDYEGKVHNQMRLTISNPFAKQLDYMAMMNLMKQRRWVETSVIPVMPGKRSIEMWPDILTSIALSDFTLKE
jgi:hypothetical protein